MRRTAVLVAAAAVLLPTGGISRAGRAPGAAASGPNVVVMMTDDQRYDDMAPLPQHPAADRQTRASRSRAHYVSYPVCCPARATFLTGQYAQNHGVSCLYPTAGRLRPRSTSSDVPAGLAGGRRLRDRAHRQVPERLRQGARAAGHPERLDGVVRPGRPLHLPDVGLRDLRERRDGRTYGSLLREAPRSTRPTC